MCVQYYSICMIEHAISCNIYLNQCQTAQIALLGLAGPAGAGLLVSLAWVAKGITIMIPTQYSNLQTTKCRCWAQKVCTMAYCNILCRDSAWFIVTQSWTLIWGAFASVCMNDRVFTDLQKTQSLLSSLNDYILLRNVQLHVNASVKISLEIIPTPSTTKHNIPRWWERLDVLDALLHRSNPPELVHFIALPHDSGDLNWLSKNQNKKFHLINSSTCSSPSRAFQGDLKTNQVWSCDHILQNRF